MSGIASSVSPSSTPTAPSSSPSSSDWSVGPENQSNPPSRDYSASIDGKDHVLRATDGGGVSLKIDGGPWMDLPSARVVLEGSNLFIKINGNLLTVEKAFGLDSGSAEPHGGSVVVPSPGRPQPAPGDAEQVPPTPGTGCGTEPTDNEHAPQAVRRLWR
jgi:hypothetical protein